MAQYSFGSGNLILVPLASAASTPVAFKALQDMSLDFKFDKKVLHGQKQFPLAVARGKGSVEGKFKDASVNSALFNSVFFGDTGATGQLLAAINEAGVIPAAVTLTTSAATASGSSLTFTATTGVVDGVTVTGTNIAAGTTVLSHTSTGVVLSQAVSGNVSSGATITFGPSILVANSATFATDGGVSNAATGQPLTKVASAPTIGQYSVSATGTYTFAAADAANAVVFSYTYTATTGGVVTTITNKDMGAAPLFKTIYTTAYQNKRLTIQLNSCQVDDLKLSAKNDDFAIPEMSFSAFADSAGNIGIVSVTE